MNVEQLTDKKGDYRQVKVVIGGKGGVYEGAFPHFEITSAHPFDDAGQLILMLPDSVAEYFRQEGRRQLQSEFRSMMNVSRA